MRPSYSQGMPFVRPSKAEGLELMSQLVARYRPLAAELAAPGSEYTETDTRVSFIDPMLEALGWDVRNAGGLPQRLAEVVMERTGHDGEGPWGRPDYRLRVEGSDVLPVEAKRPSVAVGHEAASAVQARSYGWSLSLPVSVLTNFHELVIFDATVAPLEADGASVAVRPGGRFHFEEYVDRFDELWQLLSHESISTSGLEEVYGYERPPRGESPFDVRFLAEVRSWRLLLARDIAKENGSLGAAEVGRRVQRLLNALLFLRVCEDRNIGRYKELLESATQNRLLASFRAADRAFNAGLFTVLNETSVSPAILRQVIAEMYWPRTQFAFGVLEPAILAGVYEQYLAERVAITEARDAVLEPKPELAHAGGVTPTPDFIVREIGSATLDPLLSGGIEPDLAILDLSCGSGVFLLDAFERLVATASQAGEVGLRERAALVQSHLFGVDIDGAAVEVAKLSLLLAVLGDDYLDPAVARDALPDLTHNIIAGNSVVREDFDVLLPEIASVAFRRARVSPLDLRAALGASYPAAGFSAIIGNPPYVRIQVMAEHLEEQLQYLQDARSGYLSPMANNFDLYQVFVERAFKLLRPDGRLGYIIPHRFTNLLSASAVRGLLSDRVERIVHFRELQVFPNRTTYVAIVVVGARSSSDVELDLVTDLDEWRSSRVCLHESISRADLGPGTWPMATAEQSQLFGQLEASRIARLGDPGWVNIFVGIQTSADDYYFIRPTPETADMDVVTFTDHTGVVSTIERALLKPAIRDQRIGPIDYNPAPDFQVIFPYDASQNPSRPRVIDSDTMRSSFPHAHAYFERHRQRLEERSVSPDPGDAYWAYGRSQSLGKLAEPKLIVRVLSLSPLYALDDEGLVVPGGGDGGPYYLLRPHPECPYSIDVIQAILSHPAVDLFVAVTGKQYRGSYASHRKAFLAQVPIPGLTDDQQQSIEERVVELRRLSVELRTETDTELARSLRDRRRHLVGEVEAVLSSAYGISQQLLSATTGG